MVDGPIDDQNPEDDQPENDPPDHLYGDHTSDQDRAGLDYLVSVADTRIQLYFDQNWPAMMAEVVSAISEKISPEQVAVRAEQIFETRWREEAARRQAATADGGGGGGNGPRPTSSGAGGGDDDAAFLNDVPDGDAGDQASRPMPHALDRKQAVAIAGLRFLEDPFGHLERGVNLFYDIQDRRRPKTPRDDLTMIEDLAARRRWLIDVFASPDPMAPAEKLAEAMAAGARSGMSVAEAMAKFNIRGVTSRPAPRFKPPKIETDAAAPTPAPAPAPAPTSEPVASMAQDRPARRRRRLQDAV